jgi:hypothetical protein
MKKRKTIQYLHIIGGIIIAIHIYSPWNELVWFDISVKSIVLPLIITTGLYLRIGHKFKMKGS